MKPTLAFPDCYNVAWQSPSTSSAESMPCGGGDIGLNVWVEAGELLLYVDRSGNIDENDQQLKTGRVRLRLEPNPFADAADPSADFLQTLVLRSGSVEIKARSSACSAAIKVWVEVHRPIVHIDVDSDRPTRLSATYESWRTEKREIERTKNPDGTIAGWDYNRWSTYGYHSYGGAVHAYPDIVGYNSAKAVEFCHTNGDDLIFDRELAQQKIDPQAHPIVHPTRDRIFGGLLTGSGLRAQEPVHGVYQDTPFVGWPLVGEASRTRHTCQLVLHTTQGVPLDEWREQLVRLTHSREGKATQAWAENVNWWEQFWERSYVIINPNTGPDDVGWQVGRNYNVFRYQLACNAFGEWPTRFNGGLFTFDPVLVDPQKVGSDPAFFNPDFRAWGAWTAQNQRLVYWPLIKSGDFDVITPQFEFYRRNLPNSIARTRSSWNIEGCSFCEQIGSGALPLGSHYGWEPPFGSRDPERETGLSVAHATYYTSQLEIAYMIHEWHRFCGGDLSPYIEFLKQSVIFHFDYFMLLQRRRTGNDWDVDGKLVLEPSHALETYHGRNATDVICALRFNIESLLGLPAPFINESERRHFRNWLDRLPAINFQIRQGRKVIAPILDQSLSDPGNVELPQLYPVFPWPMYTVGVPDIQIAIDTWLFGVDLWKHDYVGQPNTYASRDLWYGWGQQAIFMARLGQIEQAKDLIVKKLADARGVNDFDSDQRMRFPTFWGPGFDWTPDHNWGGSGMIALQEMLLQSTDDSLSVLPTWPDDWDVDFKLHAPHNTTVEVSFESGELAKLTVQPPSRGADIKLGTRSNQVTTLNFGEADFYAHS